MAESNREAASMDNLPLELLCAVLNQLDSLCDVVRCSLVNRRWRRAVRLSPRPFWSNLGTDFQLDLVLVDAFRQPRFTLRNGSCKCDGRHGKEGGGLPHQVVSFSTTSTLSSSLHSYLGRLHFSQITYTHLASCQNRLGEERVHVADAFESHVRSLNCDSLLLEVRSADLDTARTADPLCSTLVSLCSSHVRALDIRACNLAGDRPLAAAVRLCTRVKEVTVVDLGPDGRWQAKLREGAEFSGPPTHAPSDNINISQWRSGMHAFGYGITFGMDNDLNRAGCSVDKPGEFGAVEPVMSVDKLSLVYNVQSTAADGAPVVDALRPRHVTTERGANRGTVQQLLYLLAACKQDSLLHLRRISIPYAGSEHVLYELGVYLFALVPRARRFDLPAHKNTVVAGVTGDVLPVSMQDHAFRRAQQVSALCCGLAHAADRHLQQLNANGQVNAAGAHVGHREQIVIATRRSWSARDYIVLCEQLASAGDGRWPVYGDLPLHQCDTDLAECLWRDRETAATSNGALDIGKKAERKSIKALTQTIGGLTVHVVRIRDDQCED